MGEVSPTSQLPGVQPDVAYLGDSIADEARFPFLLVFGREYNNSNNEVRGLDRYCFGCSSGSTFWNRVYRLVECLSDHPNLKDDCRERGESPILFSNVLSRPIPNSLSCAEKRRERAKEDRKKTDEHVARVFSETRLVRRLRVVILSGVDEAPFQHGVSRITQSCERLGVSSFLVPYLGSRKSYGLHYESIELSEADRKLVGDVVGAFYKEARTPFERSLCPECHH